MRGRGPKGPVDVGWIVCIKVLGGLGVGAGAVGLGAVRGAWKAGR